MSVKLVKSIGLITINIVLFFCINSCSDLFQQGGKNTTGGNISGADMLPAPHAPVVKSFVKTATISISWEKMGEATEYILYRSDSSTGEFKEIFYQGPALSVEDGENGNKTLENFYYYKLAYKNTTDTSNISPYGYGMAGEIARDEYEENENAEEATRLLGLLEEETEKTYYCNIYNYQDGLGNPIRDYDWYYLHVPKGSVRTIEITLSKEQKTTIKDYELLFNLIGQPPVPIVTSSADSFIIPNTDPDNDEDIKFQISVNASSFGYKLGKYQITVY